MVAVMRFRPSILNLVLLLALGAALSGCGRKAGLDLPPTAAAAAPAEEKAEPKSITSPIAKPPKPQPRVVPHRSLPIDILLD
jgi:predicted small lipoprotein YifL